MLRNIISLNQENTTSQKVEILHLSSGFCRMPDALFHIPEELGIQGWKVRFIVGLSYLYALSFGKGKALTTKKELMKILQTQSSSTINAFITKVNEFSKWLKTKAENSGIYLEGGELITRKGRKGGTQCYLIDQTIIAEAFRHKVSHGGTFAFYNVALLLPISAQAKAILLYLHRKARNGSLLDGKAESEVSVRELAKVLAVGTGKGRLKGYISELEEVGAVERISEGRKLKFRITKLDEWDREALITMLQNWKEHPFLKNWQFPVEPIVIPETPKPAEEKSPIGRHKKSNRATYEEEKSPIGRHKKSNRATHRNKSNRNKSISKEYDNKEYDTIYNGVGGKKNIVNLFNTQNQIEKAANACESSQELMEKNTAPSYKKPNGFKNEKSAGELGKPNNRVGCSKLGERIDRQELEKIKKALSCIADAVQNLLNYYRIELKEELYSPLKDIYGKEWKTIAGMYELFDRKEPKFGYSRKANTNYLGLLISFALKDSQASFWDFYGRFKRVFGVKETFEGKGAGKEVSELLQKLKDSLRSYLSSKPAIYRLFVEEGILSVEEKEGIKVLKCKDRVIAEYVAKHWKSHISNLLGEYGKDWKIEF